jgi:hypothetical protein
MRTIEDARTTELIRLPRKLKKRITKEGHTITGYYRRNGAVYLFSETLKDWFRF